MRFGAYAARGGGREANCPKTPVALADWRDVVVVVKLSASESDIPRNVLLRSAKTILSTIDRRIH